MRKLLKSLLRNVNSLRCNLVYCCCCLAAQSCPTLCDPMDCSTRLPCLSPSPGVSSNSCPLSWSCHPTISVTFSYCFQSFPASGSFPMSRLFASDVQSIGTSASATVLPMNIQGWFLLGLTSLISFQSNRFSRIFFRTAVWQYQSFGAQPFLWSDSHICTWLLEKP